jgi:hypothetical protein
LSAALISSFKFDIAASPAKNQQFSDIKSEFADGVLAFSGG